MLRSLSVVKSRPWGKVFVGGGARGGEMVIGTEQGAAQRCQKSRALRPTAGAYVTSPSAPDWPVG
jgi:hypothetical protein